MSRRSKAERRDGSESQSTVDRWEALGDEEPDSALDHACCRKCWPQKEAAAEEGDAESSSEEKGSEENVH